MDAYKPRRYQQICLDSLRDVRDQGANKALVVMASGLGKTLTGAFDIREYLKTNPNGRVLVLCHSRDILEQTKTVFKDLFGDGYSYGMYNGHEKAARQTDFLFANLQSVNLHREEFDPDEFCYVIVDEAHHSPATTYRAAIEHFRPQFLLGMTATPERMDDADLEGIFGKTVYEYRLTEAVRDGWLSEVEYRVKTDEIQKMETILDSGERFSLSQLNREIFAPKRDEEIIRIIRKDISGKDNPTMVIFCQTIAHAEKFAELMGDAVVIHSQMDVDERKRRLQGFRTGKIKTVCAVDILNEGIDVPRTDVIVFLRVTQSKIVFTQQLGRGLRRAKGKDKVLVLDFVSTADRLYLLYQMEREFKSTVGRYPRKKGFGDREYFTLNVSNPVFQERQVDIMALIEKARNRCVIVDDDEMIQQLRAFGDSIGHVPTQKEVALAEGLPSHETYRLRFGSFDRALELAGFGKQRIHHKVFETREAILDAIRQKAEEIRKTPGRRDLCADENMPSMQQIRREFGSLNDAIIAAGLSVNKFVLSLSDDEMLNLLIKKAKKIGFTPSSKEVNEDPNMPNTSSYEKRFGSYNKAVEKAGLTPNKKGASYNFRRELSDNDLLRQLRRKAEELGRTPFAREVDQDPNMASVSTFLARFGTYLRAVRKAGLQPAKVRYTDEELLELLRQKTAELGRVPLLKEIDQDPDLPASSLYYTHFRNYSNAVMKAGLKPNRKSLIS